MDSPEIQSALFERWFRIIQYINLKSKNLELICEFFYTRFFMNIENIKPFLAYFKKCVRDINDESLKKEISFKYLEIISSLCERFNIYKIGQLLDDMCLKIYEPAKYHKISRMVMKYKKSSKENISKIITVLDDVIGCNFNNYTIIGRYKIIYSIYKKLQKYPDKNALQIRDLFAFRIVLNNNSIGDCIGVLKLLHGKFRQLPENFKDYITFPKVNGYQSIHTTLRNIIPSLDLPIEIQIRTKYMDDFAQNGLCAHWLYAKKKDSSLISNREKRLIRKDICFFNYPKKMKRQIYCFDSYGDVYKLEYNNTVLDFAYKRHSDNWKNVESAIINGEVRPIDYKIQDGDKIELIKDKYNHVKPEWIKFAYKRNTIKKIREYLDGKNTFSLA